MPSDNVRAIAQTPDGVMWFGTDGGLGRFDGRAIQAIQLGEGPPLKVLALETGADGTLWIGTEKGVFLYRGNRFTPIPESSQLTIVAILPGVETLLATGDGTVYRATLDPAGAVTAFGIARDLLGRFTALANNGSVDIWGTYGDGRYVFEARGPERYDQPLFINTLAQDSAGNIWLGSDTGKTGSGLFLLNDLARPLNLGEGLGNVLAIEPDRTGGAWAGTAKNGLFRFSGKEQIEHFTFENTAGGLRSDTVYAVFLDRENVVWVGTNRGICRYDGSSPSIQTLSDNANSNFVRTLYRGRDGEILAGTNRGSFTYDGKKWTPFTGFPQKTVYAIGEDQTGKLLFGGPGGVLNISGKQFIEGDTRAFANFQGKTYAAIFERGLKDVSNLDGTSFLSGTTPTALFSGADRLWIGTSDGAVYSFDGRKATAEIGFDALRGSAVRKITAGGNNTLWIAGSAGIFRFENGVLNRIVPNYDVRDLIADGTDAWAATVNGGLLHVGFDDLWGWIVSDLNVEQGLPSQQVFALLRNDKSLLIGTNRGIVSYVPGTVKPNVVTSRVLSRRLHDAGEWEKTIELEYPQNSLLVEVAGQSSRTFPEQFQYAFVLKSSAGKIVDKRLSRAAQYSPTSLQPGEYTIEARALNKDLLFSEPVVVRFSIARAPFPWTATALGVLLAIAVIALIWAIVERRRIARSNSELAAARLDLANEAERERRRIARDLHDQTLADLRNLMMASDKLTPPNTEFRDEIEAVSTEIHRICEDLSPSVLENVGLVAALEFLLSHTIENHKFTAAENAEDMIRFPVNVQLQIYRIAQEVLANIKRHANAGLVEMEISVAGGESFQMTILDDGDPFEPSAASKAGRGIPNIRSRASLIHAEIEWEKLEDGTRFLLTKNIDAVT